MVWGRLVLNGGCLDRAHTCSDGAWLLICIAGQLEEINQEEAARSLRALVPKPKPTPEISYQRRSCPRRRRSWRRCA